MVWIMKYTYQPNYSMRIGYVANNLRARFNHTRLPNNVLCSTIGSRIRVHIFYRFEKLHVQ